MFGKIKGRLEDRRLENMSNERLEKIVEEAGRNMAHLGGIAERASAAAVARRSAPSPSDPRGPRGLDIGACRLPVYDVKFWSESFKPVVAGSAEISFAPPSGTFWEAGYLEEMKTYPFPGLTPIITTGIYPTHSRPSPYRFSASQSDMDLDPTDFDMTLEQFGEAFGLLAEWSAADPLESYIICPITAQKASVIGLRAKGLLSS